MTVVEFQHVKPGKGGAFVRTKLKNVRTGAVRRPHVPRRREGRARRSIDKREMQFLYREGDDYVFMDNETYDQLHVPPSDARRARSTTSKEGDTAVLPMYEDEVVGVDLPASVELDVTETEPGMQGDRVSGARKPATLETGLVVQVPLFVERRRPGQGRHPLRRVPDPGAERLASRRQRRAGNGRSALLYEAEAKGRDAGRVLADLPVPPDEYAASSSQGVERAPRRESTR